MVETKTLDKEIEKTRKMVISMRDKITDSSDLLDRVAKADSFGDVNFDIENAKIEDVLAQQKLMESNIADLIIGLEDVTETFGAEFNNMKSFSVSEKLVGFFSKKKPRPCVITGCGPHPCQATCRIFWPNQIPLSVS